MIALGGGLGTLMRYGLALWLNAATGGPGHLLTHAGTLLANIVGSFLLVLVSELLSGHALFGVDLRLVLGTGMMGGFTTYSTFNLETYRAIEHGDLPRAGLYVLTTVATCLLAAAVAVQLARMIRS